MITKFLKTLGLVGLYCLYINTNAQIVPPSATDYIFMEQMDSLWMNINKANVPGSILYEGGFHSCPMWKYNGVYDTALPNYEWKRIYRDLYLAHRNRNTLTMPDTKEKNWGANCKRDTVPFVIQYVKYGSVKSTAFSTNLLVQNTSNKMIYDGASNTTGQAYNTHYILAAQPLLHRVGFGKVTFHFNSQFVFSNLTMPNTFQVDFGNGAGYQTITMNSYKTISYNDTAVKYIKIKISHLSSGLFYTSKSKFQLSGVNIPAVASAAAAPAIVSGFFQQNVPKRITATKAYNGVKRSAKATCSFGFDKVNGVLKRRTDLKKVVFLCDGVDFNFQKPGNDGPEGNYHVDMFSSAIFNYSQNGVYGYNTLKTGKIIVWNDEKGFHEDTKDTTFKYAPALIDSLNNAGYDFMYIDFENGAADMKENAMVVEEVISQINANLFSCEEIIASGASMGGQVCRYALLDMQRDQKITNVKMYAAFDSPHNGANVPVGLQYFLQYFHNRHFSVGGSPNAFEDAKKSFGNISMPAALGLLNYSALSNGNPHQTYLDFYNEINTMGTFPKNMRLITMVNGSSTGENQGFVAGSRLLTFKIPVSTAAGGFAVGVTAGILGGVFGGPGGAIAGSIMGTMFGGFIGNKLVHDFEAQVDAENPNARVGAFTRPFNPWTYKNFGAGFAYDHSSGGGNDGIKALTNESILRFNSKAGGIQLLATKKENFNFIPIASGLATKGSYNNNSFSLPSNSLWFENNNLDKSFTWFDAYFTPQKTNGVSSNEPHVYISAGNTKFMLNQLRATDYKLDATLPSAKGSTFNFGNNFGFTLRTLTINNGGVLKINAAGATDYGAGNATTAGSAFKVNTSANAIYCTPNIFIGSGGIIVVGDQSIGNTGELVISKSSVLNVSNGGILEIQEGSRVIIEEGGLLNLGDGAIVRLMGPNAVLEVRSNTYNFVIPIGTNGVTFTKHNAAQGGQFIWNGNLSWVNASINKLILNGVYLKCGGQVTFNNGNKLELQNSDACLDIAGTLNLGTNAKFTFTKGTATDGGYVRFSNPNAGSNASTITALSGASMEFIGAGKTDKVLEVSQHWVLIPNNLSALKIQNGMVENTASSGFGEIAVPCSLTVSNTKWVAMNSNNANTRALELYGQYHLIDNNEFRNFREGAIYYGDYYNNPLKVTNSLFQGNKRGIMGYKDGGLNLVGNSFTNNIRGVEISNAILASNVQSNIFTNTFYENTNGAYHCTLKDTTIYFPCNPPFPGCVGTASISYIPDNCNDRSFYGLNYKGASDLYMYDNTIKGMYYGLATDNNKLSLQCNTFKNNLNYGVSQTNGTLNMSTKTGSAGHNIFEHMAFAHVRVKNIQQQNILVNSGFNFFRLRTGIDTSGFDYGTRYKYDNMFSRSNSFANRQINTIKTDSNTISGTEFSGPTNNIYPAAFEGTLYVTNPVVNASSMHYTSKNFWLPSPGNGFTAYSPFTLLYTLNNTTLPICEVTDLNYLNLQKACGDTAPPCPPNTNCNDIGARIAATCTNCDNVNTQEIGVAQTNVAANNAMAKMENLTVTNRYKKSLSIFADVENTATSLQGQEDLDVLAYVHEGTITALSEGLRKKQINRANALDKAKLLVLENAYSNQINAMAAPTSLSKQLEKLSLLKNKAHTQHLQYKSDLAMATIDAAIQFVQADPNLLNEVSLNALLKDKCYYDVSHQYNIGAIQKEQFYSSLKACQSSVSGSERTLDLEDGDTNNSMSLAMLQAPAEMPMVKEPPYRSYSNEDEQGYYDEAQLTKTGLISVMPNPAQNRITILTKEDLGTCTIAFTDLSGRLLISKTITLNQNESKVLDLDLKTGIYIYTISNENQVLDKNKLVIINND